MPRHQSTAAQRARQAQRKTGGKYTVELRQAQAGSRPGPFALGHLLTACGTALDWTGENPVVDPEWAPEMFDFAPLGGPVPYSAVLLLLGLLAPTSRSTELELESRNGFHSLIVACSGSTLRAGPLPGRLRHRAVPRPRLRTQSGLGALDPLLRPPAPRRAVRGRARRDGHGVGERPA